MDNENISMSEAVFNTKGRFLTYFATNKKIFDSKKILNIIFNRLQVDENFINFG